MIDSRSIFVRNCSIHQPSDSTKEYKNFWASWRNNIFIIRWHVLFLLIHVFNIIVVVDVHIVLKKILVVFSHLKSKKTKINTNYKKIMSKNKVVHHLISLLGRKKNFGWSWYGHICSISSNYYRGTTFLTLIFFLI